MDQQSSYKKHMRGPAELHRIAEEKKKYPGQAKGDALLEYIKALEIELDLREKEVAAP